MDPDFEDQCNVENTGARSGSSSSQEDDSIPDLGPKCCSINAVNFPKASTSLIPQSDREPLKCCEIESDEHVSEGEEDASYWEQEDDKSESSLDPGRTRTSGPHPEQGEASKSHICGTGSPRVQSSSGGGSNDVAPACVSFGISEEGAEQAQRWDSGSDTALCRPNQHRARHTRLSQSERHVKETKSKCKRIALLLTHAPNPCNKGAVLFKKRRQRVEKYTFTSYGTGENKSTNNKTEEAEDLSEYNFVSTSDSELEEEYSVHQPQFEYCCNWKSQHEMEGLPATQGKGALMFAQRRKRMDEIESENEELRSKGIPVEDLQPESESKPPTTIHEPKELHYLPIDVSSPQNNYSEEPVDYQDASNVLSPLVPNRTAKPFLGFHVNAPPPARHCVIMPVTPVKKKPEPKFKVPVPVPSNVTPHVWSPTSDIIASRDERISVPAIKTCILPEAKRKGASKQSPPQQKANLQNKDDRRSFIDNEEDCFSLGAEACNFMQPKTIKLKNPPPVAPKPTINSACPPWMVKSALDDPYVSPQPSSTGPQSHDRAKPLQMTNHWAQDQTTAVGLQMSTNISSPLHAQPTTNSFSLQQSRSPVSMQACPPTHSPQPPPPSNAPNSIASYPLQTEKMCRAQTGTMAGRGAELFAKRQTRMEKFVFDAESKKVSQPRAPSPAASLPNTWRYSSNIRAPPPLAYNPLLAPFYPPAAAKQPPSTSPKIKSKQTKAKPKQATKHLNALDIMKHQPYHLDASLFKYEKVIETKAPSPSASPSPKLSPTPTKSRPRKLIKHMPQNETSKSLGLGSSPVSAESKIPKSPDVLKVDNMELKLPTSASPVFNNISKQVANNRPASTTSQHSSLSSISDNLAAAFSPASLIARGVRQMAPRPKFSAKKQEAEGKQWKPVAMLH